MLRGLMIKRAAESLHFPLDFIRCGRHDYFILMEIPVAATFAAARRECASGKKNVTTKNAKITKTMEGGFPPASDHLRNFGSSRVQEAGSLETPSGGVCPPLGKGGLGGFSDVTLQPPT